MKTAFAAPMLRLRLMLLHANPVTLAAAVVLLVAAGAFAWTLHAVRTLDHARAAHVAQARAQAKAQSTSPVPRAPASAPAPAQPTDNLAAFYGALGDRHGAEREVKTLFDLAAKSGLVLRQGEYKPGYDRNAQVYTYQVSLPVKGSYQAIWQFAMAALRALPFASLDDISFRRDAIGDATVEARLRLTLYLRDGTAQP